MATRMKAWHVSVLDGWKIVSEKELFDVGQARELEKELKAKYAESHPHYVVKREWY